jgi:hypothetical protein
MDYRPDLDATASYWGLSRRATIALGVVAVVVAILAFVYIF